MLVKDSLQKNSPVESDSEDDYMDDRETDGNDEEENTDS